MKKSSRTLLLACGLPFTAWLMNGCGSEPPAPPPSEEASDGDSGPIIATSDGIGPSAGAGGAYGGGTGGALGSGSGQVGSPAATQAAASASTASSAGDNVSGAAEAMGSGGATSGFGSTASAGAAGAAAPSPASASADGTSAGGANADAASGDGASVDGSVGGAGAAGNGTTEAPVEIPAPELGSLLLSEYVESSEGSDKAIEVTNRGSDAASLRTCSVRIFFNGNSEPGATVLLGGELAAGEALVLCHAKASSELLAHCDLFTSSLSFNGNDALLLECDGVAYDSLGQLGFDPGTGWSSEGIGTADHVLRRRCAAAARPEASAPFDVASEWVSIWPGAEPAPELVDFPGLGSPECAMDPDPSAEEPEEGAD